MTESDGKFEPEVKALVAIKAGFQCSYPGCSVLTGIPRGMIDPKLKKQDEFSETLLVGEAAHIVGRTKTAARGDVALPEDEINAEENGIWLCSNHHDMIDTLRETYGVKTIKAWKEQQEKIVRSVADKITKHEAPEIYLDEPALNKTRFSKCTNARKIILALEHDEDYKNLDLSFFNKATFLESLNEYFETWTTVPYRSRKLAAVALLRIVCDESSLGWNGPMWFDVRDNRGIGDSVMCPLAPIYESIREISPSKISNDGSWQRMLNIAEFFGLITNMVSLNGIKLAQPFDEEETLRDNALIIKTVVFKSELDKKDKRRNNPNIWELIYYVYKEFFINNPEKLINSLIVHGNASILDEVEQEDSSSTDLGISDETASPSQSV